MEVERHLAALAVQIGKRRRRIGEEVAVPSIARPAPHLAELVPPVGAVHDVPGLVPLHVDDEHVDGIPDGLHLVDERAHFFVGIEPVAAPPVAERPARRQRDPPRDLDVVSEAALVVVAVGEDREVAVCAGRTLRALDDPLPPVACRLLEERRLRVVHDRHAATRKEALLHLRKDVVKSRLAVEGSHRAQKVLPVFGERRDAVHDKICFIERAARPLKRHAAGLDHEPAAALLPGEVHRRHLAVGEGKRGAVFEHAVGAPFATHHSVGERREARASGDDARAGAVRLCGDGRRSGETAREHRARCRKTTFKFHCTSPFVVTGCLIYEVKCGAGSLFLEGKAPS